MIDFKRLGWLLREAREGLGLSVYDVERISNRKFKVSRISSYENGRARIPLARLDELCSIYGQNYYSFLTKLEAERKIRDITDLPPEVTKIIDMTIKNARQPRKEKSIDEREHSPPKKQKGGQKP